MRREREGKREEKGKGCLVASQLIMGASAMIDEAMSVVLTTCNAKSHRETCAVRHVTAIGEWTTMEAEVRVDRERRRRRRRTRREWSWNGTRPSCSTIIFSC